MFWLTPKKHLALTVLVQSLEGKVRNSNCKLILSRIQPSSMLGYRKLAPQDLACWLHLVEDRMINIRTNHAKSMWPAINVETSHPIVWFIFSSIQQTYLNAFFSGWIRKKNKYCWLPKNHLYRVTSPREVATPFPEWSPSWSFYWPIYIYNWNIPIFNSIMVDGSISSVPV
jgi:hypothetical protein